MKTKTLVLLLCMSMIFGMTACGNKNETPDNVVDSSQSTDIQNPDNSANTENNEPDASETPENTKPPRKDLEDMTIEEIIEELGEEEFVEADTSPYLPSMASTADYKVYTDVLYTEFIMPKDMAEYTTREKYDEAYQTYKKLNPKKEADKEKIEELSITLDKSIRTSSKGFVSFEMPMSYGSKTLKKGIVVKTLSNNVNYTSENFNTETFLKLMGKMEIPKFNYEIVEMAYQSDNKAIVKLNMTDGKTDYTGYFVMVFNDEYVSTMINYQDIGTPKKDWLIYTAKSFLVGR